ncbi:hypothetical protein Q0N51_25370 [Priestia megaterium]|uniref:hypothetical protein n=1 Tax=Priestia megaterium TaxID=1404 RepID=UPI00345A9851
MLGNIIDNLNMVFETFFVWIIVIVIALALIPVLMYLSKWFLHSKEMKKEWKAFNEDEKKQEQLNILKYLIPLIIVVAIIFVFISSTIFIDGAAR